MKNCEQKGTMQMVFPKMAQVLGPGVDTGNPCKEITTAWETGQASSRGEVKMEGNLLGFDDI